MLFKTMLDGGDPNWGRIMGAVGAASQNGRADRLDITFGEHMVVKNGLLRRGALTHARRFLAGKHITLTVDLKAGRASAEFLTCDLTKAYVHINAAYTT